MTDEYNLYVSIDTGGSQTKIIYQFKNSKQLSYLMMPPGIEQISFEQLKRYQERQGWIGHPTALQQAWLEWKESIYVVGEFVTEFAPQDRIKERKYENALYKVLAAIGVILEKHQVVKKRKFNIYLALVLPWNEYNDRTRFEEQLKLMFKSFKFRGQSWNLSLNHFLCRPEGGGLAAIRMKQKGIAWLQESIIAVLMFGHRNVTVIYFEKGILKHGDSPLLGFSLLLDEVCSRTSGLSRDQLATAIFKGISSASADVYKGRNTVHPQWDKLESIVSLATAKDEALRNSERLDIARAIELATLNYWETIKKWLDKNLPSQPEEVIIGGGAATFIEPELEAYFNCESQETYEYGRRRQERRPNSYRNGSYKTAHSNMFWASDIETQIEDVFQFGDYHQKKRLSEQCVSQRLIDCFGMFDQLKDTIAEKVKANAESCKSA